MAKRKHLAVASATGTDHNTTTKRRRMSGGAEHNAQPAQRPSSSLQMHAEATGAAEGSMGDPHPDGFTSAELVEACEALHSTLKRAKGGKRQYGKRTKMEKYRLSDHQKVLFAKSYRSARRDGRPVDYVRMSNSCHFTTFAGNHAVLEAMEPFIVSELHAALKEERRFASSGRPTTVAQWEEEFAKLQAFHQQQIADIEVNTATYVDMLASARRLAEDRRGRISQLEEDIRVLKQGVGSPRSAQELDLRADSREEQMRDKEEKLKRKEDELAAHSAYHKENVNGFRRQVRKLEEDRRRLEDQIEEKLQLEQRCRDAMQQQQHQNEAWKQEQSAIQKEMQRLVLCLQEQKQCNGYASDTDGWKQRLAVEQEFKKAAQAALEEALREAADLRNTIDELSLRLASYVAGAAAEHDIELFAKRFAVPPHDNISSRFKQRVFTVNMMKRIQNARGDELDADIYHFSQQRNQLCHDYTGANVISTPHEDFQALCSKIRDTVRELHATYSQ